LSLRITFELSDQDLQHFRLIMEQARKNAGNLPREAILSRACDVLAELEGGKTPAFIKERLETLRLMANMLEDAEWDLPPADSTRIVGALAYLVESEDLIPDSIPGVGFLDDAIMAELAIRDLRHEIEAYRDFCQYRTHLGQRRGRAGKSGSETALAELEARRTELLSRIQRRRNRDRKRAGGSSLVQFAPR